MMCDDCRWAAAHPAAAAQFDDEGHAKCSALGQDRCTCQHRGTPYAVNSDKDAKSAEEVAAVAARIASDAYGPRFRPVKIADVMEVVRRLKLRALRDGN